MSVRVDAAPLIAGAVVVGVPGLGVLAQDVPATGEHGPGYAYPSLTFPADAGKEIRGEITTWPTNGALIAYEDTSFEYDGASDTFEFQLYVDGEAIGDPQVVTLALIGAPVELAGEAIAVSTATGSVTTVIHCAGHGRAAAGAGGALHTTITLSGAAQAHASASASVAGSTGLAGSAGTSSNAAAQLVTQISVSGAASAITRAAAALGSHIRLSGVAASWSAASAELAGAAAGLAGAARVDSSAAAALATQLRLVGSATARARAGPGRSSGPG